MSRLQDTRKAKLEKRRWLEEQGVDVHPHSYQKKHTIEQAVNSQGKAVQTAGRIMATRTHGKVVFLDLVDQTASIQVMIREEKVGKKNFKLLGAIDRGDFLGVTGTVTTTKTKELTIMADQFVLLGKSLRALPTQWNAAENKEVRFRKRFVDMLINEKTKQVLDARWLITKEIRRYLEDEHNFIEVETPVLQPLYGGTNAKPFSTHMNALGSDFYLRIAPELYLKRLVIGGYDKIFEIARNFRNEGIDQVHQPEFTMIEWYEAYADYHRIMQVTEGLVKHLASKLYGKLAIEVGDHQVDLSGKWSQLTLHDSLKLHADIDCDNLDDKDLQNLLKKHQINLAGSFSRDKAIFGLFDNLVPPKLIEPTWIIDYPREVSPLSKHHRQDPKLAERFEAYIGGKELADGWSEITDPLDQRALFENEQKNMKRGDSEAHPLDEDFLEAMEYGLPPLGGIGIGIDRLVMFLTNTWSIREVIAFPTLRPLHQPKDEAQKTSQVSKAANNTRDNATTKTKPTPQSDKTIMPKRQVAEDLLHKYIKNQNLHKHCLMVAKALESYAKELNQDQELWYQTGLLHDLDWEKYPDEHPQYALDHLLKDYPQELRQAVASHAPNRTGQKPDTLLDRYLYACDELSGFLHAYALMRPKGFDGMKYKSVKKKLKDKAFAGGVDRDDIAQGFTLIDSDAKDHVEFLIQVFANHFNDDSPSDN